MNSDSDKISQLLKKHKEDLSYKMPHGFEKKLFQSMNEESQSSKFRFSDFWKFSAGLATGLVASILCFTLFTTNPTTEEHITQEIVSGHVRSMMVTHLSDVVSTSQHTVKPWFEGKLDFSPTVQDLVEKGYPLIGGRLDYINGRPVAALNYQHGKHLINVFEWPTSEAADTAPKLMMRRGYQIYRWSKAGMNFWAISDLNALEMQTFVQYL